MQLSILGYGRVGGGLGRALASLGHQICFGVRNPEKPRVQRLIERIGSRARAVTIPAACAASAVIMLAIPWDGVEPALEAQRSWAGKVVIDCTNPFTATGDALSVNGSGSGAELVARWAPGAQVVKAFNTLSARNLPDPRMDGEVPTIFVCGDAPPAKGLTMDLARQIGFDAVDVGPLEEARELEPMALLLTRQKLVHHRTGTYALKLLHR